MYDRVRNPLNQAEGGVDEPTPYYEWVVYTDFRGTPQFMQYAHGLSDDAYAGRFGVDVAAAVGLDTPAAPVPWITDEFSGPTKL